MPPGAVGGTGPDNDSDESDMNRLQGKEFISVSPLGVNIFRFLSLKRK